MAYGKHPPASWLVLLLALVGISLLAWPPHSTQAGPGLPSRATPTSTPARDDNDEDDQPIGAYIELRVESAPRGSWTVVQWQDQRGDWHDVRGWQGNLLEGRITWWVAQSNFGEGPFRWQVYQQRDGALLAESDTFFLPTSANETVTLEIQLTGG